MWKTTINLFVVLNKTVISRLDGSIGGTLRKSAANNQHVYIGHWARTMTNSGPNEGGYLGVIDLQHRVVSSQHVCGALER